MLDNDSSWETVQNNVLYGSGSYGFMFHGGNDDVVQNNVIDTSGIQYVGYYQDDFDCCPGDTPNYGMAGNVFSGNLVYSSGAVTGWLVEDDTHDAATPIADIAAPADTGNLYYSATGVYGAATVTDGDITVADSSPLEANPLFVNAAANDYALQPGSPASQIGFAPIDLSTIGPVVR